MRKKRFRENVAEICSFCGEQTARLHLKNHIFGQGDRMIVIENVPTFVCDNCHESYITAEVSRAIDEILAHPSQHTSRREVSVATLAA
jgi:YgiT-type zinc finger domain-containing protein